MVDNKTFCLLPFLQLSTTPEGYYQACCIADRSDMNFKDYSPLEFFNSDYMKQLRYDMVNGIESDLYKTSCQKCILNEKTTGISKRLYNKYNPSQIDIKELEKIKVDREYEFKPKYIEAFKLKIFGNLCNLKCRMCTPGASSKIAAEANKNPGLWGAPTKPGYKGLDLDLWKGSRSATWDYMDHDKFYNDMREILPITKELEIVGGEPFYYPQTVPFLKWIVDEGMSENLDLLFITNGTIEDVELYSLFNHFKDIRILVSLDGIGKREEYIRDGTIWDEKVKIVNRIQKLPKTKVSFSNTVQMLNIGYLDEIHENTLKYFHRDAPLNNQVTYPVWNRSINIPAEIAEIYIDKYKNKQFNNKEKFINLLERVKDDRSEENFMRGMVFYKKLDKIRNTYLPDVFPEFKKYYDEASI